MRSLLADTGPLYAAWDPDDQYHAQAQAELKQLADAGVSVILPYTTLLELYTLVLYRLGIESARSYAGELLEGASFVNPTPEDYLGAARLVARYPDQRITLFDGVAACLAQRLGLAVWTYDRHFDVMRITVWRPDSPRRRS